MASVALTPACGRVLSSDPTPCRYAPGLIHGYPLVQNLCAELQEFMGKHGFESIAEFKGMSLEYFTTHTDLVAEAEGGHREEEKSKVGIESDDKWTGEGFVAEAEVWSATSDDATSPVQRHVVSVIEFFFF